MNGGARVSLAKRTTVEGEAGLTARDTLISVHTLLATRAAKQDMVLSTAPSDMWTDARGKPLALDLATLTLAGLQSLKRWEVVPDIEHFLVPDAESDLLNGALRTLHAIVASGKEGTLRARAAGSCSTRLSWRSSFRVGTWSSVARRGT